MTASECKKLVVGSKFRRPSMNPHDNGWRIYEVTDIDGKNLIAFDQHGYRSYITLSSKGGDYKWMAWADRVC